MPLTNLEMEERSRKWEALGYTPEFLSGPGVQSRDIFLEDTKEKVKDVVVNIRDPSGMLNFCCSVICAFKYQDVIPLRVF